MSIRWYQQEAFDIAVSEMRKTVDPLLIEAVTAAGKSHIIAALADHINSISGKRVLCMAPSRELVIQNREKFLTTGKPASIFSASAGKKCLRHSVIFATPGTLVNALDKLPADIALIIIDEAHGITPTLRAIIERLRENNPNLRVLGLTATPYRTDTGYIYRQGYDGRAMGDETCRDPFFSRCIYRITYADLVGQYIAPVTIGDINATPYDTRRLLPNTHHNAAEIDAAFVGRGRETSQIVADVVAQSKDRRGVMLFAATVPHAHEIVASLPATQTRIITGETKKKERDAIIKAFKRMQFKYLVSVGTLTTGFDAPHVDVIALLRKCESPALVVQIIGRGVRQCEGKTDCLLLDYGGNVEAHCEDGDIFNPIVRAGFKGNGTEIIDAECPECGTVNAFGALPNDAGLLVDANGYYLDATGSQIQSPWGPLPAHYGRRCLGRSKAGQCSYRWSFKKCYSCEAENDIAARKCCKCGVEIIDPNEKLITEFKQYKKDPHRVQCDPVLGWQIVPSRTNNTQEDCLKINVKTEHRSFSVWFFPTRQHPFHQRQYKMLLEATGEFTKTPETITYVRQNNSKYFNVIRFNDAPDTAEKVSSLQS